MNRHEDLFATPWESHFRKIIFKNGQNERSQPNPSEVTVESHHTNTETCRTRGITQKCSPEVFPATGGFHDGSEMDHHMAADAQVSADHLNPTSTNPHSSKYDHREKSQIQM